MQPQKAERETGDARSGRFTERIGSTLYRVTVFFPTKETETLETKILRLIKKDLQNRAGRGTMEPMQTGRPPDGGSQ
jgi:hypothetical protein